MTNGVSRRSFVAMLGGIVLLGRIPDRPNQQRDEGIPDSARPNEVDRIRRLFLTPRRLADGRLLWLTRASKDGEKPCTMIWNPETESEIADAERFYKAATWRSWSTPDELHALLTTNDRWLIRQRVFSDAMLFLATDDERVLLGDDEDAEIWTLDPSEAISFSPNRAERLIRRVMQEWTIYQNGTMYLEPVDPSRPWWDARYQWLALF